MALQLLINEPSIGWTDRTEYLWIGDAAPSIDYQLQRGERGPLALPFIIPIPDTYAPTLGCQVKLVDNSVNVWVGTIEDFEFLWVGQDGFRGITVNCVTYKQALDTLRVPPRTYNNTTAGEIVTDLLTNVATGFPFALGTISDGADISSLNLAYDLLSDVIQNLAQVSGFIWDIDPTPSTPEFFFRLPNTVTSPVTIVTEDLQWESLDYSQRRGEFRDRQIIRLSWEAFAPSTDVFAGDGHTTNFALRNPIDHLVKATITMNTQPTATGLYTGQPSPGDILSIGTLNYTFASALDNTQFGEVLIGASADATYQNLADAINATMGLAGDTYSLPTWENSIANAECFPANNKIVITAKVPGAAANNLGLAESTANFAWYSGSESGGSPPPQPTPTPIAPILVAMGTLQYGGPFPSDGDTFTVGSKTYTFRAVINNATPNEVLIISTSAFSIPGIDQMQAVIDAINGNPLTSGTTFSSATTANTDATAGVVHPRSQFTLINPDGMFAWFDLKQTVSGTITVSSSSSVAFRWQTVQAIYESAGENFDPNNPNAPQVSTQGQTTQEDPEATVTWATGSTLIVAKEAPAAGTWLRVDYYRLGANCIAVEDSAVVAARAAIEGGTGRYDQLMDDSQNTNAFEGLARAQGALNVYGVFPEEVRFATYTQGLIPGDKLPIALATNPVYAPGLLNSGTWIIQEVRASYVPEYAFRYDVTLISATQIQSDVQFMERLAQTGGSGLGSTGPMLGTGTTQGSGGGGSAIEPVEEDLTPQIIDGWNTTFTLRWVPREFPYPTHPLLWLKKNGHELNYFGWGSPAIDPDYTIVDNVITLRVAPVATDWLTVKYFPDVGVPQLGALEGTAVFSVVNQLSQDPTAVPGAEITTLTPDAANPTLLTFTSTPFARTTSSANWNISGYGGDIPPLGSMYVQQRYGHSLSGAIETGTWYAFDVYLDFTYANADPSLPDVIVRYRPAAVTLIPGSAPQCTLSGAVGPPPTSTMVCNFTSGLSDLGIIRWGSFAESQRFFDV